MFGRPLHEQKSFSNHFHLPSPKPKGLPNKEQRYRQTPRRGLSKALPSIPYPSAPPVSPATLKPASVKIKISDRKEKRTSKIYTVHSPKRQRTDIIKTSQEPRKPDLYCKGEKKNARSLTMKGLERPIGPPKPRINEVSTADNVTLQTLPTHPAFRSRHQHSPSTPAPYFSTHPAFRNRHQHSSSMPNTSSMVFRLRAGSTSIEMVQPSSPVAGLSIETSFASRGYPAKSSRQIERSCDPSVQPVLDCFSDDDGYSSTLCSPAETPNHNENSKPSLRPALTNRSQSCYSVCTQRHTGGIKSASNSDLAIAFSEKGTSNDLLATGEEVIDLYLAGFVDDAQREEHYILGTPATTRDENWSVRDVTGVASKAEDYDLLSPLRSFSFGSSNLIVPGNPFHDAPPTPPPLQAPTATRDQYGFLKASRQVTKFQYDVWHSDYSVSLEKRSMRWFSYMKEEDLPTHAPFRFPHRCAKTERFIRKGIPPMWRGAAWFWYAGGDQLLRRDPDLYSTLVSCSEFALNKNDKEMIERDLHRTFPDNIHFKPEVLPPESLAHPPTEAPLLSSLRRVLRAFALYCPRIGYCQSLNFIAGLLLLFLPEEKTFWMLRIITTEYLPGTHDVSLEGANVDLWILMTALKESTPSLWSKITAGEASAGGTEVPPIALSTTSWFMSLFIGTLPIESVLRVWDTLFYEGSRTLFRAALTIFKLGEPRIRATTDPMEIFQAVQALPRGMLDANALMRAVCRRGGLSGAWVVKKRIERKGFYARARARAAAAGGTVVGEEEERRSPTSSVRSKADSVWKRRIGNRLTS